MDERDLIRHLQEGGTELWDRPEPPALDLAAITGQPVDPARQGADRRTGWRALLTPRPFTIAPLGFLAGAVACIAVGLVLGGFAFSDPGARTTLAVAPSTSAAPTERVTMHRLGNAPAAATAIATVYSSSDGKSVAVRVSGLPPLQHGTFYELWALGRKGRMVSLGTLSVDAIGSGAASMPVPVSLHRFPVLDLSLERADGNPAHSGHSLLRATA